MKKRTFSLLTACIMVCNLFLTPAYAIQPALAHGTSTADSLVISRATNYFSGGTGPLNSMAGNPSKLDPISSGSIPNGASVTKVEVSVTVSRGSMPFYLVVVDPDGVQAEKYISASSKVTFTEFENHEPEGTWYIYIYNTGALFTDVSTATARMTVTYNY